MTDNDMLQPGLNYELLVEDALRSVVRTSLGIVEKVGLPGETHFYISFATTHPGVEISDHLRTKHPENMTIVIQHQFANLSVGKDEFSITLFFAGQPSPMIIPFQAVTSFNDPAVGFGLQFGMAEDEDGRNISHTEPNNGTDNGTDVHAESELAKLQLQNKITSESGDKTNENSADVVSLDTFRKKPTQ